MFITNNHASFNLWCNEKFFKDQKVSKYYDHDCGLTISYKSLVRSKMEHIDFKKHYFRMNQHLTLKLVQLKWSLLRNNHTVF